MIFYNLGHIAPEYTQLGYIRKGKCALLDSKEHLGLISLFQKMAKGEICPSALNIGDFIIFKIEISSDILNRKGKTGETIEYVLYFWKPGDKDYVSRPYEAVGFEAAGMANSSGPLFDGFVI